MVFLWGYRATVKVHQAESPANDEKKPFDQFINKDFTFLDPSRKLALNPWLFNGIFQTFEYAKNADKKFKVFYGREIFTYKDGGICSLDHVIEHNDSLINFQKISKTTIPEGWPRLYFRTRFFTEEERESVQKQNQEDVTKPIVVVIHGLAGGSHEPLICNFAERLTTGANKDKWDVMVINSRGCGRTKIASGKLFTALSTDDVKEPIQELRKRYPNRPIYAIGFSFGAALLSRFLATPEGEELVKASCLVSCPWDMVDSAKHIQSSWSGSYLFGPAVTSFLVKLISNNFKELNAHNPDFISKENLEKAKLFKKITDFDDLFTCHLIGFKDSLEYYESASPKHVMHKIKTPSLILNSTDDPTVGVKLPFQQINENPHLCLVETDLGGHLAFAKRDGTFWSTELAEEFFTKYEEVYN